MPNSTAQKDTSNEQKNHQNHGIDLFLGDKKRKTSKNPWVHRDIQIIFIFGGFLKWGYPTITIGL